MRNKKAANETEPESGTAQEVFLVYPVKPLIRFKAFRDILPSKETLFPIFSIKHCHLSSAPSAISKRGYLMELTYRLIGATPSFRSTRRAINDWSEQTVQRIGKHVRAMMRPVEAC